MSPLIEKAAETAVNNVWLTAASRLSVVLLTAVMIPSGAWLIATVFDLRDRQIIDEQWRIMLDGRASANAQRIETLMARAGEGDVARRGAEEQMNALRRELAGMGAALGRIETRLDAVLAPRAPQ